MVQVKRVKRGGSWRGEYQRAVEQMQGLPSLPGVSKEIWIWEDRRSWIVQEVVS